MTFKHSIMAAAILLGTAAPAFAAMLGNDEIVKLQVEMQSHIDTVAIDGALLSIDPAKGGVVEYFPTKAHPKIMTLGDYVVMCTDAVDKDGKPAMANFYMVKSGDHHVVFHTTFGDDPFLAGEMKAGRLVMAN